MPLNGGFFMNRVYLLIGGNMGDRMANLAHATALIADRCGEIAAQSDMYETAAWGVEDQPAFLNQALCLLTEIAPEKLMRKLLEIETELGRVRLEKMGPRLIDIDILLVEDQPFRTAILTAPHPLLAQRRFALAPLAEIAANVIPPTFQQTVQELLAICPDTLPVTKLNLPQTVYH